MGEVLSAEAKDYATSHAYRTRPAAPYVHPAPSSSIDQVSPLICLSIGYAFSQAGQHADTAPRAPSAIDLQMSKSVAVVDRSALSKTKFQRLLLFFILRDPDL